MKLGPLTIDGGAMLAPMAGVADRAFRELCADYGAASVTAEMVSCKGLTYGDRKSASLLDFGERERPIGLQLFGDDPAVMAEAAAIALARSPDFLDINMGCPAPKIAGNGCGAALMRDPALCGRITEAVVRASSVPVTVKIRKGYAPDQITAVEVAKRCEAAGAAAITVHGRTRDQMYAPPVDLDIIRAVKRAVGVPVIGNGDVATPAGAARMLEETGCDCVMVGRGALGSPWIFAQISAYLNHGRVLPDPGIHERMRVMLRHIALICRYKGERVAMREARKHAAWYMRGLKGAPGLRAAAGTLAAYRDAERLAARVLESNRD